MSNTQPNSSSNQGSDTSFLGGQNGDAKTDGAAEKTVFEGQAFEPEAGPSRAGEKFTQKLEDLIRVSDVNPEFKKDGELDPTLTEGERLDILQNQLIEDAKDIGTSSHFYWATYPAGIIGAFFSGMAAALIITEIAASFAALLLAVGGALIGVAVWGETREAERLNRFSSIHERYIRLTGRRAKNVEREVGEFLDKLHEGEIKEVRDPISDLQGTEKLQNLVDLIQGMPGMEAQVHEDCLIIISRQGKETIEVQSLYEIKQMVLFTSWILAGWSKSI